MLSRIKLSSFSFLFQSQLDFNVVKAYKWVWATVFLKKRWSWNCQWDIGQGFLMCLSLYVNLWTGTRCLVYGWQQFKGIHLDIVDKGRRGSGAKNELMMLANISPRISILFRKWLSGFEAAWSSIVRDRQSGGERSLNRAGLLLTNTVPGGRDEDALLSLSAQVWLFSCGRAPRAAPWRHCQSGGLKMPLMSAFAACRSTRLPMIYAGFGQPDPPAEVNCQE